VCLSLNNLTGSIAERAALGEDPATYDPWNLAWRAPARGAKGWGLTTGGTLVQKLSLALEYFHPWPNSAGFYVARERGWYAQAGIDLELRVVDHGRGDALAHLDRGDVDLGIFPSNRLLVRREAGQDLVAVAAINQRGLETVRTRRDSGITRLRDLEGRRIAYNPTPRGTAVVRSLIAGDGGDPDNYIVVDAGVRELDPADEFGGIADATFGSYWAWDNLLTAFPAESETVWKVDEALGLEYHSYLLGGRGDFATRNRELVATFLAVTARGFAAAAEDQEHAALVFERVTPYFSPSVLRRSIAAIAPTWFDGTKWGVVRDELVGPYAHWLASHGILHAPGEWPGAIVRIPFTGAATGELHPAESDTAELHPAESNRASA
jgi:putative hydroxymethylpyrimidine transport system substrate-binding protein